MKSNFEFLQSTFPVLANFGGLAEQYCYSDSNSCLMKLGMIGETIVNLIFSYDRIPLPYDNTAFVRIDTLLREGMITRDLSDILHALRKVRNKAVHGLHSDDVLMVRVNGSKDNVGKQYRITNQKRWAFCDHIIRIKYVNSVVPQYMVYFSKSEMYRQYIKDNMVSSAGQNTISRKGMARLQIPILQKDEQEQIVSILSNLFEKEQQAKETAEQVIDQIDAMKKSILARAFRGELGTNDPADESAVELLKKTFII